MPGVTRRRKTAARQRGRRWRRISWPAAAYAGKHGATNPLLEVGILIVVHIHSIQAISKYGMEPNRPITLLERVRYAIRYKRYSIMTERPYVEWARRVGRFRGRRHPFDMVAEV